MKGIWDLKCVIARLGSLQMYSGHGIGNKITQKIYLLVWYYYYNLDAVSYNLKSNNCRFIVLLGIWFIYRPDCKLQKKCNKI